MLLMSYMSTRSLWRKLRSIRSLTRFTRRGAGRAPAVPVEPEPSEPATTGIPPQSLRDRADSLGVRIALNGLPCNDADAVYNLAALRSGLLPTREIPGLAEHVSQCETCQIVLALIVKELPPVESTANHVAAPGAAEAPEVSTEPRRRSRAPTDEALS